MRRHDDAVRGSEHVADRGLLAEHVDRGAGDHAALDRLVQRLLVHERAARGVDEVGARLHARELLAADQPARLLVQRGVQRHEVGLLQQRLERDQLDADRGGALAGDERVVGDDAHLEGARTLGHARADAPEADDAERVPGQFDALQLAALPAALAQRGVALRHVARDGEQQRQRVLDGGDGVGQWRVDDDHAARRRRLEVDVVDAHPGAADHRELRGGLDHALGDAGLAAHDDAGHVGHGCDEFVLAQTRADYGVVAFSQARDALFGDLVGNEDGRHRAASRALGRPSRSPPPRGRGRASRGCRAALQARRARPPRSYSRGGRSG